jgi:hypothetical protein
MAKKNFFVGMLAVTLVFGMALAGCKSDDDGGGGLPAIDEEVSGREKIEYSDVPLTWDEEEEDISDLNIGSSSSKKTIVGNGTWFVTAGTLTLSLPQTPSSGTATLATTSLSSLFGDTASGNALSLTAADASFVLVDELVDSSNHISRDWGIQTDTSQTRSQICYIYVNKDVTITRDAKNITQSEGEDSWTAPYAAVSLPLKTGWNLVQSDMAVTGTEHSFTGGYTVKMADKDVPWNVNVYGG